MINSPASWPFFDYPAFKSTGYLLHMACQMVGKLKLTTPFEPHWSNVALWLTSRGITSGLIPYQSGMFSVEFDLLLHRITINTTWGMTDSMQLTSMSVAELMKQLFYLLQKCKINLTINPQPQEITNPIAFDKDNKQQTYTKELATTWWHILINIYRVMQRHHAQFDGETPPVGLMWGTFDLRDARFNGRHLKPTGVNAEFIRRNAMDEEQIEVGWWPGNELYPQPAFFAFVYPQPQGIEQAKIEPSFARWDTNLGEFILDYRELQQSKQPEKDLLAFFQSTYRVGSELGQWQNCLLTEDMPI